MVQIDVRGLSCPEPVLRVSEAMKANLKLEVIADSVTAKENICALGSKNGFGIKISENNGEYTLMLEK